MYITYVHMYVYPVNSRLQFAVLRYTGEAVPELTLALEVDEEHGAYAAASEFQRVEWVRRRSKPEIEGSFTCFGIELQPKVFATVFWVTQ